MTPTDSTPESIDGALRAANNVGRIDPEATPAASGQLSESVPPVETSDEGPPAPVDLDDDALDVLLHDRSTRREVLADPAVRVRLARRDPAVAAELDRWEERARVAEEVAERRVAQAAGPRPQPLPGGGAAPIPPAPPSPEAILRAAASAARGEPIPHNLQQYVRPAHDVTVTTFAPQ